MCNSNIKHVNSYHNIQNSKLIELGLNLFYPKQRIYFRNAMNSRRLSYSQQRKEVEKEVVDCGRTVFVASAGEFLGEFDFLSRNYPWIKFYKSKDIFMPNPYGIAINNAGVSKIPRNAQILVESGIHARLTREINERKNFQRKRVGVYKPSRDKMTMEDCISTLFILCGGIAAVVFGEETYPCVIKGIWAHLPKYRRCPFIVLRKLKDICYTISFLLCNNLRPKKITTRQINVYPNTK